MSFSLNFMYDLSENIPSLLHSSAHTPPYMCVCMRLGGRCMCKEFLHAASAFQRSSFFACICPLGVGNALRLIYWAINAGAFMSYRAPATFSYRSSTAINAAINISNTFGCASQLCRSYNLCHASRRREVWQAKAISFRWTPNTKGRARPHWTSA